ncbi:MAG: hypothetical protein V4710_10520 [Verrucomicrobiota bacterium]
MTFTLCFTTRRPADFHWWLLLLVCFCTTAEAQWQTTTYSLKGGWNAIHLSGDARHDTLDNLLPPQVTEVWRWNPNPTQVQFTQSPLIPSAGTPEWSVWKRGLPGESTLSQLSGQTSYLVRCAGTAANSYAVPIKQSPLPPSSAWVRNGANLFGFPTFQSGSSYPFFSSYFSTFPAALAANTRIYKYVGGELGAGNPLQIFSPANERLDRTQAYWFSAEVVGNFYAPLEISLTTGGGLAFGRAGSVVTARIRNRSNAAVTLSVAPLNSESAPPGQTGIVGPVPLTRRTFNATTLLWTESPIAAGFTEAIGPQSTLELNLGIDRASMGGASAGALFASFLRLRDSGNLMEVYLPVSALKTSLSGLWVGDIALTHVGSRVSNGAKGIATLRRDSLTAIAVEGTGGFGYTVPPAVTVAPPASGTTATAVANVAQGSVTGFTITNSGSGYLKTPAVTVAPPPPLAGTSTSSPFPLRALLHVADDGAARLLSQVFIGQLAAAPNAAGLCTLESLLKPDAKSGARRIVSAHLPLDRVILGTGSVALPAEVAFTITIPFSDPTNPFVHQYHPDHDNKDARGNPLGAGVESYSVTRRCTFRFTASPPAGSTVTGGWGSEVIGGTYSETINGIHKQALQLDGTFELRRASEIGTLTQ